MVVKRSGVTEPFSRTKVINGVRKACQGRPVTEDALAQLGQRVEEAVRATGSAELTTHDVGLAILGPLQELDLVAYLRFASVYRAFDSLEDFEAAITLLRAERDATSDELDDAVSAFLALALVDVGREREAVATALTALARHLPRYERSVTNYARDLA
jgi:transcriptional repressor NrdR